MKKCVYTCLVGNYDYPRSQSISKEWDYICVCDRAFEHDTWKCVEFDKREMSSSLASRLPKILPHKFLSEYDYSVYIDASITMLEDVEKLCNYVGWPDFGTRIHSDRNCVFQEIDICLAIGKGNSKDLRRQRDFYTKEKIPRTFGLFENGILFRSHNHPDIIRLGDLWWDHLVKFSHRDQVSLPYVVWKNRIRHLISTFPKDFKKKFRIPTVHGGRFPIRKLSFNENNIFSKLKNIVKSSVNVVCSRSPCILSEYMNWSSVASIAFLNKPKKLYETVVLYNLLSCNYDSDDVCEVINKAFGESRNIMLLETNLSDSFFRLRETELEECLKRNNLVHGVLFSNINEGLYTFIWSIQKNQEVSI